MALTRDKLYETLTEAVDLFGVDEVIDAAEWASGAGIIRTMGEVAVTQDGVEICLDDDEDLWSLCLVTSIDELTTWMEEFGAEALCYGDDVRYPYEQTEDTEVYKLCQEIERL